MGEIGLDAKLDWCVYWSTRNNKTTIRHWHYFFSKKEAKGFAKDKKLSGHKGVKFLKVKYVEHKV